MQTKSANHLWIGGCDTTQLALQYGTPLFVYDENEIRRRIREFHEALQDTGLHYGIAYASKAFCTVAMCQVAVEEDIAIDVVSGGELYTALRAGVSPDRIHMHGNNKTRDELEFAVHSGISTVVVDNFVELSMLESVAAQAHCVVDILLRIAPGVEAHTHEYISTGQQDSKFGFDLESGQAHQAVREVQACGALRCVGLHSHIGSQIFDGSGFGVAARRMSRLYADGLAAGLPLRILNLGGGFGIRYTDEDDPSPIAHSIHAMADAVVGAFQELNLSIPEIWIEPGRSIVGPAGITLYRVGTQKTIPDIRNYVSVDGGMTDNPRLALYGAKYEAVLANRLQDNADGTWAIAGKCCESGDMVIWDTPLPHPQAGDLLAVFATGAYNYSMASHYNRNPNPAVVFVRDGQSAVVVERETWQDVVRMDRPLVYPTREKEPFTSTGVKETTLT